MNIIQTLEAEQAAKLAEKRAIPDFQPGDTVIVNVRVVEGERTRVQAYEGVVIARSGGGINESFTVRKISYGEGVERVFPVYSPMIDSLKVVRRAMVNPDRSPLSGLVEVDETQIACRTKDDPVAGGGGRSPDGKMQVIVAVEVIDKTAPGRLRLGTIKDASAASLHPFIKANVAEGATLKTDGWSAYPGVPGYTHEPHVVGKMAAHVVPPWVHRVIANLKVWAMGVYHGLRRKHLQAYLDEFVFRFNRRAKPHAAFRTLLGIGVAIKPATYKMLIKPEAQG